MADRSHSDIPLCAKDFADDAIGTLRNGQEARIKAYVRTILHRLRAHQAKPSEDAVA